MPEPWSRQPVQLLIAVAAPFVVSLALVPFRSGLENTNFALVLVLVVVAVSALGDRPAGIVAALGAGAWFDFFFTQPYQRFTIDDRADYETAVLLLLVGVGVNELAAWGRRQRLRAEREAGYVAGIAAAADLGATGGSPAALVDQVSMSLVRALELQKCRFQYGVAGLGAPPRLRRDGQVVWKREVWDVDRQGLPADVEIELLVEGGGELQGRFMLTAGPRAQPSVAQRLVAVALADQVGAALSRVA